MYCDIIKMEILFENILADGRHVLFERGAFMNDLEEIEVIKGNKKKLHKVKTSYIYSIIFVWLVQLRACW